VLRAGLLQGRKHMLSGPKFFSFLPLAGSNVGRFSILGVKILHDIACYLAC